jgi:SHS2 domain-containing protein
MTLQPFDILEHTADVAILARGRDLCELITNAAAAMLSVLYSGPAPKAEQHLERDVEAEAPDLLVHHVLRELLYLLEDEGLAALSVSVTACSGTMATLRVGVTPREAVASLLSAPIKAVTRHGLGISEADGLLTTRIVFDV